MNAPATFTRDETRHPNGPAYAYAWIIVSERDGNPQHGDTYYAKPEIAEQDAAWYRRWNLPGAVYRIERVSTARCGLTHKSRIPELEAARAAGKVARKRQAHISKLVRRGYEYGDAIAAAQRVFPFDRRRSA